jgi:hypothetical protein
VEAECSSETSLFAHKTTLCHNPGDHNLNNHHCENLRTYVSYHSHGLAPHTTTRQSFSINYHTILYKGTISLQHLEYHFIGERCLITWTDKNASQRRLFTSRKCFYSRTSCTIKQTNHRIRVSYQVIQKLPSYFEVSAGNSVNQPH